MNQSRRCDMVSLPADVSSLFQWDGNCFSDFRSGCSAVHHFPQNTHTQTHNTVRRCLSVEQLDLELRSNAMKKSWERLLNDILLKHFKISGKHLQSTVQMPAQCSQIKTASHHQMLEKGQTLVVIGPSQPKRKSKSARSRKKTANCQSNILVTLHLHKIGNTAKPWSPNNHFPSAPLQTTL